MQLASDWNNGGAALIAGNQEPSLRTLIEPGLGLTLAQLKAQFNRWDGLSAFVGDDEWVFRAGSALTGDDIMVATPDSPGNLPGRWVRKPGSAVLRLPFVAATLDAAALLTLQAGARFMLEEIFWRVTTSFTGGTSAAIGLSSSKSGFTAKGDLLGGASGDVLATLAASTNFIPGTVGTIFDTIAEKRLAVFNPGDAFRHDRITSNFTAGVGEYILIGRILTNPGA